MRCIEESQEDVERFWLEVKWVVVYLLFSEMYQLKLEFSFDNKGIYKIYFFKEV